MMITGCNSEISYGVEESQTATCVANQLLDNTPDDVARVDANVLGLLRHRLTKFATREVRSTKYWDFFNDPFDRAFTSVRLR